MSWVRLDDGFFDHPKVMRAGRDARDLFLAGGAPDAARGLTDGFIDAAVVPQLAQRAGIEQSAEAVFRLLQVGLWERADEGYRVHDFLDYNPSAEQVRHEREQAAERQAAWRSRHVPPSRNGVTDGVTAPEQTALQRLPRTPTPEVLPVAKDFSPEGVSGDGPGPCPRAPAPAREGRPPAGGRVGAAAPTVPSIDVDVGVDPATREAACAVWNPVRDRLRGEMARGNHDLYITPCSPLGIADGELVLAVGRFGVDETKRFVPQMLRALADIPDAPRDVRLVAQ